MKSKLEFFKDVEVHMAVLYHGVSKIFPEDSVFWDELVAEEKNHASLINTVNKYFLTNDIVEAGFFAISTEVLVSQVMDLEEIVDSVADGKISRNGAINLAYKLKNSAAELSLQKFMDND